MANKGKVLPRWTEGEVTLIEEFALLGLTDREMSDVMWRSFSSVRCKRKSLGITRTIPEPPPPVIPIMIADIQTAVEQEFGVPRADLLSPARNRKVARPRQVGMYLSRKLTRHSFHVIARKFGRTDHTTARHGFCNIERLVETDPDLKKAVESAENFVLSTHIPTIHRAEACRSGDAESIEYPMEQSKIMEAV